MFETHFEKIYLTFFEDRIFQLRKIAVTEMKAISKVNKNSLTYLMNVMMPLITKLTGHKTDYLKRSTGLYSLSKVVQLNTDNNMSLTPIFQTAAKDKVPNIRMIVCKVFKEIVNFVSK